MAQTIVCPQCGTVLPANTRFCSECGYPIQPEYSIGAAPGSRPPVPPTQKVDEYPAYSPPPVPDPTFDYSSDVFSNAAEKPGPRSRPLLIGAGIFLGVCCLAVIGVSFLVAIFGDSEFNISLFSSPTPTATHTPAPTNTPVPTHTPVTPPTQPPVIPDGGATRLSDTEFFDDFSTTDLNWYVTDTDQSMAGYDSGGYAIHVKVPDFRQLSRPPLATMSHIEFNAQVLEGGENGVFGVACYYVDIQNYRYAEFYLPTREYRLGRIEGGQWIEETDWSGFAFASDPLKFGVDCTAGAMGVYINDTLMVEIPVNQPNAPGEMWLFGMTWSDAAGGIKVLFDNMYGYVAVQ